MARDEKQSTALATIGEVQVSQLTPDIFSKLLGEGFASIDTVLLGASEDGKQPLYMGELIGAGEPIQVGDPNPRTGEVNMMPTFAFHPLTPDGKGGAGVAKNVTHIIPASYVVAHACNRILKQCETDNKTAWVGIIYRGKGVTRKKLPLNLFSVFEKYLPQVA